MKPIELSALGLSVPLGGDIFCAPTALDYIGLSVGLGREVQAADYLPDHRLVRVVSHNGLTILYPLGRVLYMIPAYTDCLEPEPRRSVA